MNKYSVSATRVSCLDMPFPQNPFPGKRIHSIPRLIPRNCPYQETAFICTDKHTCIHKALTHTDVYTAGQSVYVSLIDALRNSSTWTFGNKPALRKEAHASISLEYSPRTVLNPLCQIKGNVYTWKGLASKLYMLCKLYRLCCTAVIVVLK